jgi:homocysteine S-methyltransferase
MASTFRDNAIPDAIAVRGHDDVVDAATSYHIGFAVNPAADDLDNELERFQAKVEAGAHFAMTQILYDLEYMDRFVDLLGGEWPIPVLIGIFPVWSHQLALRLHNEVPGIVVPDRVLDALRDAGAGAAEVGMAIGRELLAESRGRAQGAYVVAPFRRPLGILDLLS